MHHSDKDFIYYSFSPTNKFSLQRYIPITIHLQTPSYPQVRGRLNRSLFCRKMTSQKVSCRKIGKLGEEDVIKL
jgi:hypothetical protein